MDRAIQLRSILKTKGLVISRISQKLRENFTALAQDEFCDDYGQTLKALWDRAIILEPLIIRVQELEKKILELENKKDESKKEKTMLGGNDIK